MKLSLVCLALVALVALSSCFVAASELDAEMEREVRSYVSEMEYVDHVDVSQSAELPVADHATLMETGTTTAAAPVVDTSMHFEMDNEAEAAAPSDFDLSSSFLEMEQNEVDTDVARAMALEIHEAAQSNIDEEGEVASSFVEMTSESESEAEADAEAEAEASVEAEMDAELKSLAEMEAELNSGKKSPLSEKELEQERADIRAERKAKEAEAKDRLEELADKKKANADAKVLGVPVVVTLPEDLSASHAETIRVNKVATRTIRGALGEMNAILAAKDDTIRSLVYNISYITVSVGQLANKVDQQKAYIELLRSKLHLARRKNKELHDHVEHSADTVVAIRGQLKQVERRLNKQDRTTSLLSDFLSKNKDTAPLPPLKNDLIIKGTPVVSPKASHLARRMHVARQHNRRERRQRRHRQRRHSTTMRPVEGTQVLADAHGNSVPFIAAGRFAHHGPIAVHLAPPSPLSHPTYEPPAYTTAAPYQGIPTIVIERADNGQ